MVIARVVRTANVVATKNPPIFLSYSVPLGCTNYEVINISVPYHRLAKLFIARFFYVLTAYWRSNAKLINYQTSVVMLMSARQGKSGDEN